MCNIEFRLSIVGKKCVVLKLLLRERHGDCKQAHLRWSVLCDMPSVVSVRIPKVELGSIERKTRHGETISSRFSPSVHFRLSA